MKKAILILTVVFSQMSFSQVSFEKNKLTKDGVIYKSSEYKEVFKNPVAKNYFEAARSNHSFGNIFGFVGGFGIGFGAVKILSGRKEVKFENGTLITTNNTKTDGWLIAGTGVGLVGIGLYFVSASNKNAKKAIAIENGESTAFQPYFKVESAGNGLALSYNF